MASNPGDSGAKVSSNNQPPPPSLTTATARTMAAAAAAAKQQPGASSFFGGLSHMNNMEVMKQFADVDIRLVKDYSAFYESRSDRNGLV
jgi:hypothetical protein